MENKQSISKLFVIIAGIFIACLLISNIIAGKMWAVTSDITLPAAVILFPITYIFGDIFTEVYGFRKARLIIWLGFGCSFFAALIYLVTLWLPHPVFWTDQDAFAAVLGTTPRIAAASFAGYLFGEFSNSIVLSKLKVATSGKNLWLRTILSTVVGEAFDSILFIMISFAGTMAWPLLWQMVLFQYLFKLTYEVVLTPATYLIIGWLKRKEGIDTYDYGIKYRIFGRSKASADR